MPQKGFVINGKNMPLADALTAARAGEIPYPPALLLALFSDRCDPVPTPSALDGCLRRFELQRTTDYYTIPEKGLAAAYGTAFHSALEVAATAEDNVQESRLTATIDVDGTPYVITGTPDHVDEAASELLDWKTKNYVGVRFQPSESHIRQVNVYAWLYWKVKGVRLKHWRIVYIAPNMSPAVVKPVSGPLDAPELVEGWIAKRIRAWAGPVSEGKLPYPQDSFFEEDPKKQGLCNWCPVRAHCEAAWEEGR